MKGSGQDQSLEVVDDNDVCMQPGKKPPLPRPSWPWALSSIQPSPPQPAELSSKHGREQLNSQPPRQHSFKIQDRQAGEAGNSGPATTLGPGGQDTTSQQQQVGHAVSSPEHG